MNDNRKKPFQTRLMVKLTILVFSIMTFSALIVGSIFALLIRYNLVSFNAGLSPFFIILVFLIPSVVISTVFTAIFSRRPILRPVNDLVEAIEQISGGNFDVRMRSDYYGGQFMNVANSFNKMATELNNIETLRSDFISNFSHEFKTPIVSLRGFAKLLKKGNLSEAERQEYLDIIIDESERLAQLASNTLTLSRLENQDIVMDKAAFSLDEQLRQCIVMLEGQWSKKNITVHVSLESCEYFGSESILRQVWVNLLTNAIKFSEENGEIVVSLKASDGNILVTVSDNGLGMDAETQKRIFDKFYQGDKSRTREGNGLGLSIVKQILHLCNADIKLQSQPGQGSAFTVVLPTE